MLTVGGGPATAGALVDLGPGVVDGGAGAGIGVGSGSDFFTGVAGVTGAGAEAGAGGAEELPKLDFE